MRKSFSSVQATLLRRLPRSPKTANRCRIFRWRTSIQAKATVLQKDVESDNIVAKLSGSDPKLKSEYVVLSAHLDHLGIGEPINGDKIYNGAMDNASGSALLLDLAAAMHRSKTQPKRSLLFLFVTAEEKGLLGSKYFAAHPTVPKTSIVADLNTDMFLPIYPLKVLTVLGLNESNLGDDVREVAQRLGVEVQPDPEPLRNAFVRSDQYSFIRQGVPSLAMGVGTVKGSPEAELQKKWLTERYHAPSDDLDQPVDLAAAGKFEDVLMALAFKVADAPQPPQWKSDSFFVRFVPKTATATKNVFECDLKGHGFSRSGGRKSLVCTRFGRRAGFEGTQVLKGRRF